MVKHQVKYLRELIGSKVEVRVYNSDRVLTDRFAGIFSEADFKFYTNLDYNFIFKGAYKDTVAGTEVLLLEE